MKKILILANSASGLYKFRKELLEELIKTYEICAVIPKNDEYKELLAELVNETLEINISRRSTNMLKDIKLFFTYKKIVKMKKPDIVLTYSIKPNIYGGIVCRIKKIPYIANITGLGTALEKEGKLQKILIKLYRVAFKKINCVFFQNKENMKFFIDNRINVGNSILLPGSGVNLTRFKLLDYPNLQKPVSFIFIGRIMKEKGIEQYLQTAEYITKKYNNVEFHILGSCEEDYENKLKELEEQKIIMYHGMQKNVIPFIQKSFCTIHPTFYPEGMSNVLLESAASGRPIITTNRSGCKEIVDNKINGLIVNQQDTKDLIEKVEMFIEMPYEQKLKMGLEGRKKAEKEFDRSIIIENYVKKICEIME